MSVVLGGDQEKTNKHLAMKHPVDQELATVMDDAQFFGPTDWCSHYGVEFGDEVVLPIKLTKLKGVLSEDCPFTLGKKIYETHFLFFIPSKLWGRNLTIRHWQEVHTKDDQPRFRRYDDALRKNEDFTRRKTSSGQWHLIFTGVVPGSQDRTWEEQSEMLPETHEVPLVCKTVALHFLVYLKSGEYINQLMCGRVRDTDSEGDRVIVGLFGFDGLCVEVCWDHRCFSHLGVFAARKLINT